MQKYKYIFQQDYIVFVQGISTKGILLKSGQCNIEYNECFYNILKEYVAVSVRFSFIQDFISVTFVECSEK
jgi:hypothetical protein